MKARHYLGFALLAALPWVTGCTSSRTATTSAPQSSNSGGLCGGQGFFARLCGKKEPPKQTQGCLPQYSNDHQGQMYQGTAMYMEGPSLGMGSSCSTCGTTGTMLPGSSLPCAPGTPGTQGAPGVIGQPGTNVQPSPIRPYAQPAPANSTKLSSPLNPQ